MSDKPQSKTFTFKRVEVTVTPTNWKLIEWYLDPLFRFQTNDLKFYVEWARAAGEWTRINPDEPIVNECMFVDQDSYRCSTRNDIFYRVVVDDGIQEYNSKPESTLGILNQREWLLARDIIRKEYLRLLKYVGARGYLLKRRHYGPRCPTCIDHDVEEPVTSQCTSCFGTGYLGGYYNGLLYYLDLSGTTTSEDVKTPFGTVDNKQRTARCVAYPRIDSYDIWVDATRNKRHVLRKITTAVEMRGQPLVYVIEDMRELPASRIEYQIPLQQDVVPIGACTSSTASSCTPNNVTSNTGWRRGISAQDVW